MAISIQSISRVLFINPFGIGDVLFTTPLVARVRAILPHARIGFVCNQRAYPVLRNNPDIDRIWVLERDALRMLWRDAPGAFLKEVWGLLRAVRAEHFDIAFDLSLSDQFGFFLWVLGVRHRLGFRFRKRGRFLSAALPLDGYHDRPVAQVQLGLLDLLSDIPAGDVPSLQFKPSRAAEEKALAMLQNSGVPAAGQNKCLLGIAPGGGESWGSHAAVKRWSPRHFAGLCRLLKAQGHELLFLGSPQDQILVQEIARDLGHPVASLAGQCSLEESAAVLPHCEYVVTNDGGLLHLAVAQRVPTVSFFGPTDDRVYGPFPASDRHLVLAHSLACRPCYQNFRLPPCPYQKRCLEEWSPQEAFEKIMAWQKALVS